MIKPGKYKHFKGDIIEVIGTALHSETLEEFVLYKHGNNYWVRPVKMFEEEIERDGKKVMRFVYIEN